MEPTLPTNIGQKMKYHQIEAFYQVMLTRSISQAAANLGRTQPAISMTISTLEDLLGTRLFDRHAGRLIARAEAEVLFEQIGPVITQLHDIRRRFSRLDAVPVPRISIITANNPGIHLIPSAIRPLTASGQQFRLMNGTSSTIVSEIENQRHDLGVSDQGPIEIRLDSPLYRAEVFEVAVCAVFPKKLLGPLGRTVTTSQLAAFPCCGLYTAHRMAVETRAKMQPPSVEFENFFPMACYAVASGSVAIVDAITWSSMRALTDRVLAAECRPVADAPAAIYYLLRPKYRPQSTMTDRAHEAIRLALEKQKPDKCVPKR
jgi:DNA-binding transcriptional LysR family regulator